MENMETNDNITTEAIEEIAEAVPTGNSGLKTVAKAGVIGAVSIAAWELAVKPAYRWVKGKIAGKKAAKKSKKSQGNDGVPEEVDLDEIPEIDE